MARFWKWLLTAAGLLAVALGVVWIGRGTGAFPFPAENFMTGHMQWAWRGGALALGGALAAFFSRRI